MAKWGGRLGHETTETAREKGSVSWVANKSRTSFLQSGEFSMVFVGQDHSCLGYRGFWIPTCFLPSRQGDQYGRNSRFVMCVVGWVERDRGE